MQNLVDETIRKNIVAGNAVRIDLDSTETFSAHDAVNRLFKQSVDGRLIDLPALQVARNLQETLFFDLPQTAKENLVSQLENPLVRDQLYTALEFALKIQKRTPYRDITKGFTLTLLMDWDGVFYTGDALAHVGRQQKTVYLGLNTLLHVTRMSPEKRVKAEAILQAILEHEIRDWARSEILNAEVTAPIEGVSPDSIIIPQITSDWFVQWRQEVKDSAEPLKLRAHQEDIGSIDPVYFQNKRISFDDVNAFWNELQSQPRATRIQRTVEEKEMEFWAIKPRLLPPFYISSHALRQVGALTAAEFIDILYKAAVQRGVVLSDLFPEELNEEIIVTDLDTFMAGSGLDARGVNILSVAPAVPIDQLDQYAPVVNISDEEQLRAIVPHLPADYFIVSPMYNLLTNRDNPNLINDVIQHAHERGYLDKLIVLDDHSTDGTRERLMMLNSRITGEQISAELSQAIQQIERGGLSDADAAQLEKLKTHLEYAMQYRSNPDNPTYGFNMVLRAENGRRSGAIRDAIEGLYALAGQADSFPERVMIVDGDSFIEGADVPALLNEAASIVGSVDENGRRTIGVALPLSTHFGTFPLLKSGLMQKLNYAYFTWIRAVNSISVSSIAGGGGVYSLPYLLRAFKKHSGIFETDDIELSTTLLGNQNVKFKTFARQDFRVVTDAPETLTERWQRSKRWHGGIFQVVRKYDRSKISDVLWKFVKGNMLVYTFLTIVYPSFVIAPLVQMMGNPSIDLFVSLSGFLLGSALVLFALPIAIFSKDTTLRERLFAIGMTPILGLNFVFFNMVPTFFEYLLTVWAVGIRPGIKTVDQWVAQPVVAGLKFIAGLPLRVVSTVSNAVLDSLGNMMVKNPSIFNVQMSLLGGGLGALIGGWVNDIAHLGLGQDIMSVYGVLGLGIGYMTSLAVYYRRYLRDLPLSNASFIIALLTGIPTDTKIENQQKPAQTDQEKNLARKDIKPLELNEEIRQSILNGRAIRLTPDLIQQVAQGRLSLDDVIDTIPTMFELDNPGIAQRFARQRLSKESEFDSFRDGMQILDEVFEDMLGTVSEEPSERQKMYQELLRSVTVLFGEEEAFGTFKALGHAGGTHQTVYIHERLLRIISGMQGAQRSYGKALLQAVLEHELRDIERKAHKNDIGMVDTVPDPLNSGQIITFNKLEVFWSDLELLALREQLEKYDNIAQLPDFLVKDVSNILKEFSRFRLKRSAIEKQLNQDNLASTVRIAGTLFDQLIEHSNNRLLDFYVNVLTMDLTPEQVQSLVLQEDNLIKEILLYTHHDHFAGISDEVYARAQEFFKKIYTQDYKNLQDTLAGLTPATRVNPERYIELVKKVFGASVLGDKLSQDALNAYLESVRSDYNRINGALTAMDTQIARLEKLADTTAAVLNRLSDTVVNAQSQERFGMIEQRIRAFRQRESGQPLAPVVQEYTMLVLEILSRAKERLSEVRGRLQAQEQVKSRILTDIAAQQRIIDANYETIRSLATEVLGLMLDSRNTTPRATLIRNSVDDVSVFQRQLKRNQALNTAIEEYEDTQKRLKTAPVGSALERQLLAELDILEAEVFDGIDGFVKGLIENYSQLGFNDFIRHLQAMLASSDVFFEYKNHNPFKRYTDFIMENFNTVMQDGQYDVVKERLVGTARNIKKAQKEIARLKGEGELVFEAGVVTLSDVEDRIANIENLVRSRSEWFEKVQGVLNRLIDESKKIRQEYERNRYTVLKEIKEIPQADLRTVTVSSILQQRAVELVVTIQALQSTMYMLTDGSRQDTAVYDGTALADMGMAIAAKGTAATDKPAEQRKIQQARERNQERILNDVLEYIENQIKEVDKQIRLFAQINLNISSAYITLWRAMEEWQFISDQSLNSVREARDALSLFQYRPTRIAGNAQGLLTGIVWETLIRNDRFLAFLEQRGVVANVITEKETRRLEELRRLAETEIEAFLEATELQELQGMIARISEYAVQNVVVPAVVYPKSLTMEQLREIISQFQNFLIESRLAAGRPIERADILGIYSYLMEEDNLIAIIARAREYTEETRRQALTVLRLVFSETIVKMFAAVVDYKLEELNQQRKDLSIALERKRAEMQALVPEKQTVTSKIGSKIRNLFGIGSKPVETQTPALEDVSQPKALPLISETAGEEEPIDMKIAAAQKQVKKPEDKDDKKPLGPLKDIGDEDAETIPLGDIEVIKHRLDALGINVEERPINNYLERFQVDAANMSAEIRDGLTKVSARILANDPIVDRILPASMSAFHFIDDNNNLVILIRSDLAQNTNLMEEAVFHEAREAYWSKRLMPQEGVVSDEMMEEINRNAHRLAAAEQALTFGSTDALSGFIEAQLQKLAARPADLRRLIMEDRQPHNALIVFVLSQLYENVDKGFGSVLGEKVAEYESLVKRHASSLYMEQMLRTVGFNVLTRMANSNRIVLPDGFSHNNVRIAKSDDEKFQELSSFDAFDQKQKLAFRVNVDLADGKSHTFIIRAIDPRRDEDNMRDVFYAFDLFNMADGINFYSNIQQEGYRSLIAFEEVGDIKLKDMQFASVDTSAFAALVGGALAKSFVFGTTEWSMDNLNIKIENGVPTAVSTTDFVRGLQSKEVIPFLVRQIEQLNMHFIEAAMVGKPQRDRKEIELKIKRHVITAVIKGFWNELNRIQSYYSSISDKQRIINHPILSQNENWQAFIARLTSTVADPLVVVNALVTEINAQSSDLKLNPADVVGELRQPAEASVQPPAEAVRKQSTATSFYYEDVRSYILLYSDLPIHQLLAQLNDTNVSFDEFAGQLYESLKEQYGIGDPASVEKSLVLNIQGDITKYIRAELAKRGVKQSLPAVQDITHQIIENAVSSAGGITQLIEQRSPRGLKEKLTQAARESIEEKIVQLKKTDPQTSALLERVYGKIKDAPIVVLPSRDGSYGISTNLEGYQFASLEQRGGATVIFMGEGVYDALLTGGFEEALIHLAARDYFRNAPESAGWDAGELFTQASRLRNVFGDTLPGMYHDLMQKGLNNQKYKPLIDHLMAVSGLAGRSLSPATINEIITNLGESFELDVEMAKVNVPIRADFKMSDDFIQTAVGVIRIAMAKPDIYLFPKDLIIGKLSPSNFMLKKTFKQFKKENEKYEGRQALFVAVSLDGEKTGEFKRELDTKILPREGVASSQLFDFIATVDSMDGLVELIGAEYPDLSPSDMLNRIRILDVPKGKLSSYAANNGYRYQEIDPQDSMKSMHNTNKSVFMIDLLRAFGSKQLPKDIRIIDIREFVALDNGHKEALGDLIPAFVEFIRRAEQLPAEKSTYSNLTEVFYTAVYSGLDAPTREKFKERNTVIKELTVKNLISVEARMDNLPAVFLNFIAPGMVAGSEITYLKDKLREQINLYKINKTFERVAVGDPANKDVKYTTMERLMQLQGVGGFAITQDFTKYLQVDVESREIAEDVMQIINQSAQIDEAA
ncbi:hypothetical protein KDK77_02340 [bacterium]|nr:hypothetical protein [bacterium]